MRQNGRILSSWHRCPCSSTERPTQAAGLFLLQFFSGAVFAGRFAAGGLGAAGGFLRIGLWQKAKPLRLLDGSGRNVAWNFDGGHPWPVCDCPGGEKGRPDGVAYRLR